MCCSKCAECSFSTFLSLMYCTVRQRKVISVVLCPIAFCQCRVLRAGECRQKDVGWPFKIIYVLDTDAKVHYFSATTEADRKV